MRSVFLISSIFFFMLGQLVAQSPNFLLMGSIEKNTQDEIIVEIDKRYINNTVEEYGVMPNMDSKFGLSIRIEVPQLIKIKYGHKSCMIFVEPYDTLIINFNGFKFPEYLEFEGRGKANNYLWQSYTTRFPQDDTLFNYHQYRKGIYYYKIHKKVDAEMRESSPLVFQQILDEQKKEKQHFFDSFLQNTNEQITSEFKDFMQAEIYYGQALKKLAYGDVYRGRHQLDQSYFGFLDSVLIQKDFYLGNTSYRNFLMAWINIKQRYEPLDPNPYISQYQYAQQNLEKRSKYFTMARMIALALRKNAQEDVLAIYENFIEENPYYELDKLVLDPFQKSNQFAAGAKAPDFKLLDVNNHVVSLDQFKGKVVYLDFWATWCRPCMEKLQKMQKFEPKFEGKNVVFLHVSLDGSQEKWKQLVENQKLVGTHLFFNPQESDMTKLYEVLSVPKFFLITKAGNFAYTPSSYDSEELALAIKRLIEN